MKRFFFPLTFISIIVFSACGGGNGETTKSDPSEDFYNNCLSKFKEVHAEAYAQETTETYCHCVTDKYMETFTANERSLMMYGMNTEQTVKYEETIGPCLELLQEGTIDDSASVEDAQAE